MMKKIMISAAAVLMLAACSSDPQFDRQQVTSLLEKGAGWTQEEYAAMFDQLKAATSYLQDNDELSPEEQAQILEWTSDMNYYVIEALNDGLLSAATAEQLREWLSDNGL